LGQRQDSSRMSFKKNRKKGAESPDFSRRSYAGVQQKKAVAPVIAARKKQGKKGAFGLQRRREQKGKKPS